MTSPCSIPIAVPAALRERRQWVCWRYEERDGEVTKVPYRTTGAHADTTAPQTWTDFASAWAAFDRGGFDGVGFVFAAGDGLCGIDLDHCRDADTGIVAPWAMAMLAELPTYAEVSPSGEGIHLIACATLPEGRRRRGSVECYDHARYFTVTGNQVPGTPADVLPIQDAVNGWHATYVADPSPAERPVLPENLVPLAQDDETILSLARNASNGWKFVRLFDHGDLSGYGSHSEADAALCALLAFWWQRDALAIDRLYRRSALMRPKWERTDYRERTIGFAVERTADIYTPSMPSDAPIVTIGSARWRAEGAAPRPFPLDALPATLRDLAHESATSKGAPADFCGAALLAVAGAAIGPSYELALKPDFVVGSNVWVAVVGDPGTTKTPSIGDATLLLEAIERDRFERFRRLMAEYREEVTAYERTRKGERGEPPSEPVLRSVLITDTTVEALIAALGIHNGVLLSFDELVGWLGALNQYKAGKGNDRQFYLSAWSRRFHAKHRRGDGPLVVHRPHLSIVGGIQPDRLTALSGEGDDGLTDRFLWTMPDAGPSDWSMATIAAPVRERAAAIIGRLVDGSEAEPFVVRLAPAAVGRWVAWHNARMADLRHDRFPGRLRGVWSKLPEQAGRLALIVHAAADGGAEMTDSTLEAGLALADYFSDHAIRVTARFETGRRPLWMRIYDVIVRGEQLTRSEISKALGHHVAASEIRSALADLADWGWAHHELATTGGRAAEVWSVRR